MVWYGIVVCVVFMCMCGVCGVCLWGMVYVWGYSVCLWCGRYNVCMSDYVFLWGVYMYECHLEIQVPSSIGFHLSFLRQGLSQSS